jgi:hypothetical protein
MLSVRTSLVHTQFALDDFALSVHIEAVEEAIKVKWCRSCGSSPIHGSSSLFALLPRLFHDFQGLAGLTWSSAHARVEQPGKIMQVEKFAVSQVLFWRCRSNGAKMADLDESFRKNVQEKAADDHLRGELMR